MAQNDIALFFIQLKILFRIFQRRLRMVEPVINAAEPAVYILPVIQEQIVQQTCPGGGNIIQPSFLQIV